MWALEFCVIGSYPGDEWHLLMSRKGRGAKTVPVLFASREEAEEEARHLRATQPQLQFRVVYGPAESVAAHP